MRNKMNENLRELITFGEIDLEEREKFEEKYRVKQKVLEKLRSKKRFRNIEKNGKLLNKN